MANTFMKLVIDDTVWGFEEIFSDFGEIVTLPGRQIDRQSLLDCDILIVRSRTRVNKKLLQGTKVQFVGSTVAGVDHIDEAYLREWEEEILADSDMGDDKGEGKHLGGNMEKGGSDADENEEMEKVNHLREMLAESGDDHLSFYSILCVEYKVIDDKE